MAVAYRPRSTRDRPAKPPLSEAAVVDAALALLAAEGLGAVTMRRVATALDTGPASLYVYVAGRDGLLRAVQERVLGTVALTAPDPARWREQLHALLRRLRDALIAHPGIAAAVMAEPPTTEAALLLQENLLATLGAGGLDPRDAAWGCDLLVGLVDHAAVEADVRRADRADLARDLSAVFTGLPADRFPTITAHAAVLVEGSADDRFGFAVDVVLDGLLARGGGRRPASPAGGSGQPAVRAARP